jgi:hypothetical protein
MGLLLVSASKRFQQRTYFQNIAYKMVSPGRKKDPKPQENATAKNEAVGSVASPSAERAAASRLARRAGLKRVLKKCLPKQKTYLRG